MPLRRKAHNRCFDRRRVLEVKVRSAEARRRRLRFVLLAGACALLAATVGLLGWRGIERALNELVFQSGAFAVRAIHVHTDGVIPADLLRRWTGVRPGDNLLALDLRRIKRDLELSPLVRSAAVERVLPHTLRLHVRERTPIARARVLRPRAEDQGVELATCYLDETGFVMMEVGGRLRGHHLFPPDETLPLLVGLQLRELAPGRTSEGPALQTALRFLTAFRQSPLARQVAVDQIELGGAESLLVTTAEGSVVTLAGQRFEQQLARWGTVLDHSRRTGRWIATLDLSVTNNLPLRWVEAEEPRGEVHRPRAGIRNPKEAVALGSPAGANPPSGRRSAAPTDRLLARHV